MKPILYINGYQIDLAENAIISQTKQINDIANLDTRESNYTNSFKAVKNANNLRAFNMMTLVASKSRVPYQKNTASLYSSSGECFIYNGFAKITDAGDSFDIVVYDGIIDFFKAIENKTISSLDLSEINHFRTDAAIFATWNDTITPYKYIFADYNGKVYWDLDLNRLNTDYLIPSISVEWLWNKIFDTYGVTYTGSIFETDDFKKLYITYPKGLPGVENLEYVTMFEVFDNGNFNDTLKKKSFVVLQGYDTNISFNKVNNFYVSTRTQSVKINFSGILQIEAGGGLSTPDQVDVYLLKNLNTNLNIGQINVPLVGELLFTAYDNDAINFETVFSMQAGDNYALAYFYPGSDPTHDRFGFVGGQMDVVVSTVIGQNIDFEQSFVDFQIKDFIKEIINRFGLTIYPNKTGDAYEFLTIAERIDTLEVTDWTDKNPIKQNTNYSLQGYGRKNTFRYKYNDEASDYNDGVFYVDDFNLPESKVVFESRVYTVERFRSIILGRSINVYKMYEKEPTNETGGIKYKPLDKRFYFLKTNFVNVGNFQVGSELLNTHITRDTISLEDYSRMGLQDTFQDYYDKLGEIVNDFKLERWQVYLNDSDILNLNLKSKFFLQQESSYYLLNRLLNYVPYKPTVVELIKLKDSLGFTPFQATEFEPFGIVSEGNVGTTAKITFNKEFQVIEGQAIAYAYNYNTDELLETLVFGTFGGDNFIVADRTFRVDDGEKYYFLLPAGQVESIDGEPFSITNKDTWTFTVTP